MATMIPENVEAFKTDGERRFFKFMEIVAKPDQDYFVWYLPDIEGKEPDFLLYSKQTGLVIFEVKDWAIDQINEADPHQFKLWIGNKVDSRKNPLQQARDYMGDVMDKIKKDGKLVSGDPIHRNNPKIPISCGVVFPNINKYDYIEKDFDRVIGHEKIFFWDDLHPDSPICSDPSGQCFHNTLIEKFSPKFGFLLSGQELIHLKQLIFPNVRIKIPQRDMENEYQQRVEKLQVLDHHQETIARKFDGGQRIIVGPSGSGKTLVLVHKAEFLKQYNPGIENILFVCYNITLVNYIKRLLGEKNIPLGDNGVTVKHFYELCTEIIDEKIAYENEEADYYRLVCQEALNQIDQYNRRYDAVLVDEGQDFTKEMFEVVAALINPKTNNLTIALDDNQNIYRKKARWKDMGIQAQGRVHKISNVYRNTIEIKDFANRFIQQGKGKENQNKDQLELFSDFSDFHGPKPKITQFEKFEEITANIADKILNITTSDNCPYSEIAVIYAMKNPVKDLKTSLPEMIESKLESKGILNNWVSENYRSKRTYDITTNSVAISTIHSVKGLDYSVVFLLGVDFLAPKSWSEEQIEKLIYVAITRARYQLFIPYVVENQFISKLKSCL